MASRLFVGAVSDILFEINVTSNLGSSVHRSICRTARGSSSGCCQRPGYPSVGPRSFLNRNMPVFRSVGLPQILLRWCQPTRSRNRIIWVVQHEDLEGIIRSLNREDSRRDHDDNKNDD